MKVEVYNDHAYGSTYFKLSFNDTPPVGLSISDEQLAHMHSEGVVGVVAHALSKEVHKHILAAMKGLNAEGKTFSKYPAYDGQVFHLNWEHPYEKITTESGFNNLYMNQPAADSGIEALARQLPAADVVYDGSLCTCQNLTGAPLYKKIIHWNDSHKYSREKIADYLDKLHDDGIINIEFDPWKDEDEQD